ncbi:hypothetical protein PVAP13_8KG034400 [Panicum virgatum]|uniref:RING-type domain-containing protein n=2 Tax=Panicum virgatum TaxID=38727 RepID=A0A8T0PGD0_PANVG|nr:hypothetical protein PVAP13_8KG034400 [Panicum virgatum]
MPHLLIPALAGEPHADPEPALPMEARNTEEEFANIFARFALLAPSMHLTPAGPNAFELSVRSGHVFPGAGGLVGVPASGDAMAALPEECAVCLEGYAAGDTVRTLPCSHGFHGHCILRWLAASRLCPLCRFAMPAEVEPEADDDARAAT